MATAVQELAHAARVARREPGGPLRVLRRHRARHVRVAVQEVQAARGALPAAPPGEAALLSLPGGRT